MTNDANPRSIWVKNTIKFNVNRCLSWAFCGK